MHNRDVQVEKARADFLSFASRPRSSAIPSLDPNAPVLEISADKMAALYPGWFKQSPILVWYPPHNSSGRSYLAEKTPTGVRLRRRASR